jgi:hypothetical protein
MTGSRGKEDRMASVAENITYLQRHLSYEISMLAYCFKMLDGCKPGTRMSMYFECFAVHARNCKVFLMNEDGNNCKAKDYNKQFVCDNRSPSGKEAVKLITRLDTRVFHLAKKDRESDRITVGDALKMYQWLTLELMRFGNELPQKYKSGWKGSITPPTKAIRVPQPGAFATNHFTNTGSYAPAVAMAKASNIKLSADGKTFVIGTG